MGPITGGDHEPNRPGWTDCLACGQPWPCEPAQKDLRAKHPHEAGLAIAMWEIWQTAMFDNPLDPAHVPDARDRGFRLHHQIFGWTRPRFGGSAQ